MAPVCVWLVSWAVLAMPKSVTLGRPSAAISTLAGFKSRWMMPARWALSIAFASSRISSAASRLPIGRPPRRRARLPFGQYSSVKNGEPSASPTSYTCTMFAC